MRWKIMVSLCLMLLIGMASAYAEKDNPIRILLNGFEVNSQRITAQVQEGHVLVPIKEIAEKVGLLTNYNEISETLEISNPSVNVVLARDIKEFNDQKALVSIIHSVKQGEEMSFYAFAKIDKAPLVNELSLKFLIEDPSGTDIAEGKTQSWDTIKDGNVFEMISPMKVAFVSAGEYEVKLQMKDPNTDQYITVGQASIYVK